ncbi:MAG: hypothetical protein IPH96_17655 [Saprospiraceae bacterium]|nr:hypothetical protein [Saprospiraceae bacterium]
MANLLPADYIIMFVAPSIYKVTSANTTTDTNDSDADPLTGNSPVTTITSGESEQNNRRWFIQASNHR